jgi:molybdopterin-binding protein
MALESSTYIDGLVTTNPTGTDLRSEGDDHLRLLKSTIKNTLPALTGAMTASHVELNVLDGATLSTVELNYNDVPTLGTVESSRTVTADAVGTTKNLKTQKHSEIVNALGTVSTSTAIDFNSGNVVTATIASGASFSLTNPPTNGIAGSLLLILINAGTATSLFPSGVKWAGGSTPTLSTSGTDLIKLVTTDNGSNWYATLDGLAYA